MLADNQHRKLQRLLVIQARIDGSLVGAREIALGQFARATDAFGNVFSGQFQVDATQT